MRALPLTVTIGLGLLLAGTSPAQEECIRHGERVGPDRGYPVRAEVAGMPAQGYTGRETVRYLVRLSWQCLRSQDMHSVDAISVRLSNDLFLANGRCRPVPGGRTARVLWSRVPAAAPIGSVAFSWREVVLPRPPVWTRAAPTEARRLLGHYLDRMPKTKDPFQNPTTELHGGWADLPLGETLPVEAGTDLVLGLELRQEPWECPLLYSARQSPAAGRSASYLQLRTFEYETTEGTLAWAGFDCNANGRADQREGHIFRVNDPQARTHCGLAFVHQDFDWAIRAKGR